MGWGGTLATSRALDMFSCCENGISEVKFPAGLKYRSQVRIKNKEKIKINKILKIIINNNILIIVLYKLTRKCDQM